MISSHISDVISDIVKRNDPPTREEIIALLSLVERDDREALWRAAAEVKRSSIGNGVYFRGLIELSNLCRKDCLYCGIRKSNRDTDRYNLLDRQVLESAEFAWKSRYGSIAIQAGEVVTEEFVGRIERLLKEIKELSRGELGITISLGEQSYETYQRWFNAGAHRYLLRVESSNQELFKAIHPQDKRHLYSDRVTALSNLKEIGYQTGTGVMIALPGQTIENLADDIIFMRDFPVDMVGMGPYLEHQSTPLYSRRSELMPIKDRFNLTLNMIAVLRIVMPYINIAAATALQAIDPLGREKAIEAGANIVMPNITPGLYRNSYALYENKPCVDEEPDQCKGCLDARIGLTSGEVKYGEWGDSKQFYLDKK